MAQQTSAADGVLCNEIYDFYIPRLMKLVCISVLLIHVTAFLYDRHSLLLPRFRIIYTALRAISNGTSCGHSMSTSKELLNLDDIAAYGPSFSTVVIQMFQYTEL